MQVRQKLTILFQQPSLLRDRGDSMDLVRSGITCKTLHA